MIMSVIRLGGTMIGAMVLGVALSSAAAAQGWTTSTAPPTLAQAGGTPAAPATQGQTFDERQLAAIKSVTAYFNGLANLRTQFVQTNPDGKKLKGKLAVKRPGRFRFDYNLPSRQVVVSDGKYLAIQDLDIKTDDRYELDRTPFRLLLKSEVDLLRDATIFDVQVADDLIIVALQDKSPDTPGRIKLFLSTKPVMELKEWVTTDAQNLETRVELTNADIKEDIDAKLFEIRSVALEKLQ
jgi:outer membrane lipoprotein-sorting protein